MKIHDITGQKFGRLLVISPESAGANRHVRWRCLCDCVRETVVGSAHRLTSGNTKSCGCLRNEKARDRHLQHGEKGSRLYNIWKNARQRCRNPKNPDFYLYGARGIKFAIVWDDFTAFREWALQNGYSKELTLDRIDPDGDYTPDNCRWATWREQRLNQRRCKGGDAVRVFEPYPHQVAGVDWIIQKPACALIWSMGSG